MSLEYLSAERLSYSNKIDDVLKNYDFYDLVRVSPCRSGVILMCFPECEIAMSEIAEIVKNSLGLVADDACDLNGVVHWPC